MLIIIIALVMGFIIFVGYGDRCREKRYKESLKPHFDKGYINNISKVFSDKFSIVIKKTLDFNGTGCSGIAVRIHITIHGKIFILKLMDKDDTCGNTRRCSINGVEYRGDTSSRYNGAYDNSSMFRDNKNNQYIPLKTHIRKLSSRIDYINTVCQNIFEKYNHEICSEDISDYDWKDIGEAILGILFMYKIIDDNENLEDYPIIFSEEQIICEPMENNLYQPQHT